MQCHLARHPVAGTAQWDELWLFEEQLRRWSEQGLDFEQRREVSRLRQVIAEILALAEALKHGTIEEVLSREDAELGPKWLLCDVGIALYRAKHQGRARYADARSLVGYRIG